jgi:hypothetical protein
MILLCSISCSDLNNNSVDGDVASVDASAAYIPLVIMIMIFARILD